MPQHLSESLLFIHFLARMCHQKLCLLYNIHSGKSQRVIILWGKLNLAHIEDITLTGIELDSLFRQDISTCSHNILMYANVPFFTICFEVEKPLIYHYCHQVEVSIVALF